MIIITIDKNDAGQRLDRFLRKYLHRAPLSMIYRMIRRDVKVNGRRAEQKTVLKEGDELILYMSDEQLGRLTEIKNSQPAAKRTFRIIYEDDGILIVNKPAGLLIHGDSREKKNTLVNQVIDYLIRKGEYVPRQEKSFTPAAANRLDRNTSGMVLFGKDAETLRDLSAMIRERGCIEKHYMTVVKGIFPESRILTGKAEKDEKHNRVMIRGEDSEKGRLVVTEATPLASGGDMTLLDINLVTGRTHQIRAHLASEGFPVAGDVKYGDPLLNRRLLSEYGLKSQFLHAFRLDFTKTAGSLSRLQGRSFTDPLPDTLGKMADQLFGDGWKYVYRI